MYYVEYDDDYNNYWRLRVYSNDHRLVCSPTIYATNQTEAVELAKEKARIIDASEQVRVNVSASLTTNNHSLRT